MAKLLKEQRGGKGHWISKIQFLSITPRNAEETLGAKLNSMSVASLLRRPSGTALPLPPADHVKGLSLATVPGSQTPLLLSLWCHRKLWVILRFIMRNI